MLSQVEARKQADREHEAYALYTKSREILSHGSFNLRKFATNAPSLQSITVLRLELLSALCLARLMSNVTESLSEPRKAEMLH